MSLGYFTLAFLLSVLATPLVFLVMRRLGVVDRPKADKRKIHAKPTPLGGGWAIWLSFFSVVGLAYAGDNYFGVDVAPKHLLGLFIGSTILMAGGFLDDKYTLRARHQILFPVFAALSILALGVGPHAISNPWGGVIDLSAYKIPVYGLGNIILLADFIVFFWLMGMMFTTKFLDGLDGLVTGVVAIGALIIFFLSRDPRWLQPEVALVALIFAGACLGFLVWNWHPAKIFLGEGGSLFTGFVLGTLAIISGGKIATTLLVMGLPALDVVRVIARRAQKKTSVFAGDNEHLHFKLLRSGLSQRQAVILLYSLSLIFGLSALVLQTTYKLIAFGILLLVMLLAAAWFARAERGPQKARTTYETANSVREKTG